MEKYKPVEVLPVNFIQLSNSVLDYVMKYTDFCYPKGTLLVERAHPQLVKSDEVVLELGRVIKILQKQYKNEDDLTSEELDVLKNNSYQMNSCLKDDKIQSLIDYMSEIVESIRTAKQFAYPDRTFADNNAHTALQRMRNTIHTHRITEKTLLPHIIGNYDKNMQVDINIVELFDKVNVENCYKYAYPNDHFSSDRCHACLQMLLAKTLYMHSFLECIEPSSLNRQVKDCLEGLSKQLLSLKDILFTAYPDNNLNESLGHEVLTQYIRKYRNFKEKYRSEFNLLQSSATPINTVEEEPENKFKKLL